MVDFFQHPQRDPMRAVSHGAAVNPDDPTGSPDFSLGHLPRLTDTHSAPHTAMPDVDGHAVAPLAVATKTNPVFAPNPFEAKPSVPLKMKAAAILRRIGENLVWL